VRKADKIIVLSNGEKKEEGSHEDLFALKGLYFDLVMKQE
jgi:ATP-binding cassette, subfamily B, multidrug efflux pump